MDKTFIYLARTVCSLVTAPALSLLMVLIVIALVRDPPSRLGGRRLRLSRSN
jgi:hypothetical protein